MAHTMQIRRGLFSLDDGPSYAGYTADQTWNGWACPLFTKEVADQIAVAWAHDPLSQMAGTYDATTDTYAFLDPENEDEPALYPGEDHVVDGQPLRLYPIGAGCWVWDED